MFIRAKRSVQKSVTYEYLQIVHSDRDGGRVRQKVLATLGRREALIASGALDGLLMSLARFSQRLRVVEAVRTQGVQARTARRWGPALIFGRLWEQQGLPVVLRRLAVDRRFGFDIERTTVAMALQRLCAPGSDLQGSAWVKTVEAPGFMALQLQPFYRTCGLLHAGRAQLEQALFFQDRDLFADGLDLLCVDTTSTDVSRDTESPWRKRGYSRDRRGDLPQCILCVAVDRHGWPVAWEIFPGNTADTQALRRMVGLLRERFQIRRAIIVADRGMIAQDTLALLTNDQQAPFEYILGCRMRQQKEVSEAVLARAGRYRVVADNLEVKEVMTATGRYLVCRNPEEAERDAAARQALLAKLEATLAAQGPKAVISNRGFARFLKVARGAVTIDQEAIAAEARLDGKFVLRTNTELTPAEVATSDKGLGRVERGFRKEKSTLDVRPIFHHRDDTSIGHIVASFLALRLEVDLHRRLEARGVQVAWPDLRRDLAQVDAVVVDLDGRRYRLRTDLVGAAHEPFAAAGVRVPSPVIDLGPIPEERTAV
jgi:hypothetical protein